MIHRMSPDESAGNLTVAVGFLMAGLALPWLERGSHWVWVAPVVAVGLVLVCVGLRRLWNSR